MDATGSSGAQGSSPMPGGGGRLTPRRDNAAIYGGTAAYGGSAAASSGAYFQSMPPVMGTPVYAPLSQQQQQLSHLSPSSYQQQHQQYHQQQQHHQFTSSSGTSGGGSPVNDAAAAAAVALNGPCSSSSPAAPTAACGPLTAALTPATPAAATTAAAAATLPSVPVPYAAFGGPAGLQRMGSVQQVTGVTRLMQQCSSMLRERMYASSGAAPGGAGGATPSAVGAPRSGGYGSPPSFDPQEVLFPVVDSVLGQITQEYEKRLLAKDHDASAAREPAAAAQRELDDLRARLAAAEDAARRDGAAAAAAEAELARGEAAARAGELEALRAALAERDAELAGLRGESEAGAAERRARELELRAELEEARRKLNEAEDVQARYRSVVEANRALYNEVQDLKGAIRVFCRVRPLGATGDAGAGCVDVGEDEDTVAVYHPASNERREFRVNRVFGEATTQDGVYADTQPLVRSVLDGYNVCIFAYGQTGSGKTHTMSGTAADDPGINYRALEDLFALRDARADEVEYRITVQMLEIYNEALRDLLADGGGGGASAAARLDILSTQASGCNVPGAVQVEAAGARDVARLMARGAANRATGGTKMNDRSSRSHQILTVIVDGYSRVTGSRTHGCLHLVDLAGSERVSKSEASGDRLVEAQHINRSLSALGDVIAALAARSPHVPFRNSKLTQLLQDSLCGQAKVMMFMHIAPEASSHGESVSTLNFAQRVSAVALGQAKRNVESGRALRAAEALAAARSAAEQKDGELRAMADALAAHRREAAAAAAARDAAEREARELRAQLEAARREAADSARREHAAHAHAHGAAHRAAELQHQAHAAAVAAHAHALAAHPHHHHPHRQNDGAAALDGDDDAFTSPAAAAAAVGAARPLSSSSSAGKVPRLPLDRAPARDQYSGGGRVDSPRRPLTARAQWPQPSAAGVGGNNAAGALTPRGGSAKAAAVRLRSATPLSARGPRGGGGGGDDAYAAPGSMTARSDRSGGGGGGGWTPGSAGGGAPGATPTPPLSAARGSASAQRHADRLAAARLRASGARASLGGAGTPASAARAKADAAAAKAPAVASMRSGGTWGARPGAAAKPAAAAAAVSGTASGARTARVRSSTGGGMWK